MFRINTVSYFFMTAILIFTISCSSDDETTNYPDNNNNGGDNPEIENRISSYEFTITGGELDGQTFSGEFPNDNDHGLSQFISDDASNIEVSHLKIKFTDTTNQGMIAIIVMQLPMNENDEILEEVGQYPSDLYEKSGMSIQLMGENNSDTYLFASNSGSVNLENLEIEQNVQDNIAPPIDCDTEFQGEFRRMLNLGGNTEPQLVNVTGELEIRSVRDSQ